MSVPKFRDHTTAIIEALEALGLTVGDGEAPAGAEQKYAVVYRIPSGAPAGVLDDPNADVELVYQVTCVGANREQAEWVLDKACGLFDGFEVPDRYIARVSLDGTPGVERDDDVTPHLFYATPRFRIKSTPGGSP